MNRLARETSPYLLQHAGNPVDWYPWGPEALARAQREDRPILVSIGYAACHWCHVMAHESFEDPEIARVMNESFINVKVDREERPDIDGIYMQAVQALTGQGGWPMTMFLTPLGEPFYGGTYYPPEDRHGMPSFRRVLESVARAYRERPDSIAQTSKQLRELYDVSRLQARSDGALTPHMLDLAYRGITRSYDARNGGLEGAPKFPPTMSLDFLLRSWRRTGSDYALEMTLNSFLKMARGGIHDQVGGGFHRYTVDAAWLVPHFEKMLYDNGLLIRLGAHLWQATGDGEVRRVCEAAAEWVHREMTSPEGGFYSSLDADSEGQEGRFYVWTESELDALLAEDAAVVKAYYGVTSSGNFEGLSILHVPMEPAVAAARAGVDVPTLEATIARAREALREARSARVRPGRDEKILASWNGLMLRGLATAARAFESDALRERALRNGEFLYRNMVQDARVMRSFTGGSARIHGFLEDYAAVGLGFLALYELSFDTEWIRRAEELADAMVTWFWDDDLGVFFDTPSDAEALIARPRDIADNAIPSGTSLAADLLLGLAELCMDPDRRRRATFVLESLAAPMIQHPSAFGHLLGVADMAVHGAVEVALAGVPGDAGFRALEHEVAVQYVPSLVLAGGRVDERGRPGLLEGREARGGAATAYVCRSYVCEEPAGTADVLATQLGTAGKLTQPPS